MWMTIENGNEADESIQENYPKKIVVSRNARGGFMILGGILKGYCS